MALSACFTCYTTQCTNGEKTRGCRIALIKQNIRKERRSAYLKSYYDADKSIRRKLQAEAAAQASVRS